MNRRDLLSAFGLAAGGAVYDRVNGPSFLFDAPQPLPCAPVLYGGEMDAMRVSNSCRLSMLRDELAQFEADLFDYCLTDAGGAI